MNNRKVVALIFFVIGFIILLEQYLTYGVWFQVKDIHHETFALASFAMAIGILIGLSGCKREEQKNS